MSAGGVSGFSTCDAVTIAARYFCASTTACHQETDEGQLIKFAYNPFTQPAHFPPIQTDHGRSTHGSYHNQFRTAEAAQATPSQPSHARKSCQTTWYLVLTICTFAASMFSRTSTPCCCAVASSFCSCTVLLGGMNSIFLK